MEDPLYALGEIARDWRSRWDIPLMAITGSNGKTGTKEMTAAILSKGRPILKNEGNLNNLIGLPLTLMRLGPEHRAAVVEIGMNVPGEIRRLCEIADPQFGLITQVAAVHLEGVGSIEGIAREKGDLFRALPASGTAVVNLDDPSCGESLAEKCRAGSVTYGTIEDPRTCGRRTRSHL